MSALKKIFGAGDSRDDEIMYRSEGQSAATGGSTATENVDREIQSSRDIGTGAQDNPGFVSKATDTSNVQSQFANTSSSNPPATYAQESNTQRNTAIAGAGAAGAAGTGAIVYASDRVEGDSKQDDISKATYTERSYALASDSTSRTATTESQVAQYPTDYSRDPTAPGATGRSEPVTSESQVAQHPTGYSRDPNAPGAVGATSGNVPGAFPSEETRDPVSNPGVPYTSTDRSYDADRSRFDPVSNPDVTSTSEDRSYGKEAAIAGGATAAAGAAGYGAYSATDTRGTDTRGTDTRGIDTRGTDSQRTTTTTTTTTETRHQTGIANVIDPRAQHTDERKVQEVETHYGRDAAAAGAVTGVGAGAGYTVASSEDNRVHTDTSGHNYLHKKSVEESGEKKQGFFSKAFHGPRKDEEVPIGDSKPSNEIQRSGESASMGSDRTPGLPHDDSGLITLVKEDSNPDAPALVIREKPGGGVETVPRD